jgi:hypothetical protein
MYAIDLRPKMKFRLIKEKSAETYTCVDNRELLTECTDSNGITHYFHCSLRVFQIVKLKDVPCGREVEIEPGNLVKILDSPVVGCTLKNGDIAMYSGDREVMI